MKGKEVWVGVGKEGMGWEGGGEEGRRVREGFAGESKD